MWALCYSSSAAVHKKEGSIEATLTRSRDLFNTSGDTLANEERMVDIAPLAPTVAVQQGGGDPDDSGYVSNGEKPVITSQRFTTVERVIGMAVLPYPS